MTFSRRDLRAYEANPLNVAALCREHDSAVNADLSTKAFTDAAMEILTLPDDEFRQRIHEFGFAAAAIVARIAKGAQ